MDADVTPDDEGGYFTWTDDEIRGILTADEYAAFTLYFTHTKNTMHHDDNKFVLSVSMGVNDIASASRLIRKMSKTDLKVPAANSLTREISGKNLLSTRHFIRPLTE